MCFTIVPTLQLKECGEFRERVCQLGTTKKKPYKFSLIEIATLM